MPCTGSTRKSATSSRAQLALERVEVAERHLREAGQQRPEALGELGVAVRRERAEREPVEAVLGREDARAAGRGAAELERRLDRLGARAREEHALEPRRRAPEQLLGEERRQRRGAELHRAGQVELERLDERGAHARVVAADVEHPEAAEHVEELVAVARPRGTRPRRATHVAVEADRLQDARELRVDRAPPEVDVAALARREQLGEAEVAHALTLAPPELGK